jgi:hypothetical protein
MANSKNPILAQINKAKGSQVTKQTIIDQAKKLGFDFSQFGEDEDFTQELREFFSENAYWLPQVEVEIKPQVINGGKSQHVNFMDYSSTGDHVDFEKDSHFEAGTKIIYDNTVQEHEGIMKNFSLYYIVEANENNQD